MVVGDVIVMIMLMMMVMIMMVMMMLMMMFMIVVGDVDDDGYDNVDDDGYDDDGNNDATMIVVVIVIIIIQAIHIEPLVEQDAYERASFAHHRDQTYHWVLQIYLLPYSVAFQTYSLVPYQRMVSQELG